MDVNKKDKNKKILLTVGLVLLVIFIIGITYATFNYSKRGKIINSITTGMITMSYQENENGISITDAMPMSDDDGKLIVNNNQVFDFTVSSNITGNKIVAYEVTGEKITTSSITDDNGDIINTIPSTLGDNDVKIYLEKSVDGTNYSEVYSPSNYIPLANDDEIGAKAGEMILDTSTFTTSTTVYYKLRMWVAETYQLEGESKSFTLRVNVYGGDNSYSVNEVRMNTSSATLKPGETVQLSAIVNPSYAINNDVTWASSDDDIAIVDENGLVSQTGVGEAIITATTSNGKSANTKITTTAYHNIIAASSTCYLNNTSGSCEAGTKIDYQVNNTTSKSFYVVKDTGNTLLLLSNELVVPSGIKWNNTSPADNTQGPSEVLEALENVTNEWSNVNTISYSIGDSSSTLGYSGCSTYNECSTKTYSLSKSNVKARLITVKELVALGCTNAMDSCPNWVSRNYYWTMNTSVDVTRNAWHINISHFIRVDNIYAGYIGASAIVEINK